MVVKKEVKCKNCGSYPCIYIDETEPSRTVTIKCKCGHRQQYLFRGKRER